MKTKQILFVLILQFISIQIFASHNMGSDISFSCINNCTLRFEWKGYRDCTGIVLVTPTLTFSGIGPGCTQPFANSVWSQPVTTEITPICPGVPTRCTDFNAVINGMEEVRQYRDYEICSVSCSSYVISWTDCCRPGFITSGQLNENVFISDTLNFQALACNSSPRFTHTPPLYICYGSATTIDLSATDPDGDSLSYTIGSCYSDNGVLATYAAGYSPQAPLGTAWQLNLNSYSGMMTISPNPGSLEQGVVCVYVSEWKNGIKVGSIVRDFTISVVNCPSSVAPTIALSGNTLHATPGNAVQYQWYFNGSQILSPTGSSLPLTVSGTYTVRILDCGTSPLSLPFVWIATQTEDYSNDNLFSVSPNPSNGTIHFKYLNAKTQNLNITLTDLSGKIHWQKAMVANSGSIETDFDFSEYPCGIYFVVAETESSKEVEKWVKR